MIVTSIPRNPQDGQTILLRLGESPFSFVWLTYDATYGKWTSLQFPLPGNQLETGGTTGSLPVAGTPLNVGNYKRYYDAGLRPQARCVGRYANNNTGGTATVKAEFFTPLIGQDNSDLRGATVGVTSPGGTTSTLVFDSGWQDFDDSSPGELIETEGEGLGLFKLLLLRNVAGTASVVDRQWWLRWVATPKKLRQPNVFVVT